MVTRATKIRTQIVNLRDDLAKLEPELENGEWSAEDHAQDVLDALDVMLAAYLRQKPARSTEAIDKALREMGVRVTPA